MIEVKNVTKKYGNNVAVDNINFTINDGEIVGFLGRNGAGKSTTMNMITGFIEPTSGEIIVEGYNIDKNPKKVKKQIGYMPEGVPLYLDLTVKEFVNYMAELKKVPGKEREEAVRKALEKTGLLDVQNKLNKNLSRGYKQRVSMAGALVGNPKILILDEPTVGLDPKQVTEIRNLIKSLRKDHTVILSSHILSEVSQICEKVIIIDKGKILAVNTPENLEQEATDKTEIILVVVDELGKFEKIKEIIPKIEKLELLNSEDKTKTYKITSNPQEDIRKDLFNECSKENIAIIEMKKEEVSLEDAFIKIIDNIKKDEEQEGGKK